MNPASRYIRRVSGIVALLMASGYAYAVDCPGGSNFYHVSVGSVSPITTTINVAVASNFKDAGVTLADNFVAGTSYQVNLCQGASGTIASSITGGNTYNLALFLSADYTNANTVYTAGNAINAPFLYATGVPIWLLSPNAYASHTAASYFLTGQSTGVIADGLTSNVDLKHASGTPVASTIAIANDVTAPYGVEAEALLTGMSLGGSSLIYNAGSNVTSACSGLISGSQWQCMYNNVDLTLQAINNNSVTGGFVAWSQVCNATTYPTASYVKFSNAAYTLDQYGVLVNIASSAQKTVAAALYSYMNPGSTSWNTFLTSNCYLTI